MKMKKEYSTIEKVIKKTLRTEEDATTLKLMNELNGVKKRGSFTKDEFLKMGMWKSPRPKWHYLNNSEKEIISVSKKVIATKNDQTRAELLTSLQGVAIPTASAILTLIYPKNYGVIDIRVWQVLYLYGSVKTKPNGKSLNSNDWHNYLMILRCYAKKFNVSARDIERTLFFYHKNNIQDGNLYQNLEHGWNCGVPSRVGA